MSGNEIYIWTAYGVSFAAMAAMAALAWRSLRRAMRKIQNSETER
jgi:heme exporter protein CcmD